MYLVTKNRRNEGTTDHGKAHSTTNSAEKRRFEYLNFRMEKKEDQTGTPEPTSNGRRRLKTVFLSSSN